MNYATLSDAVNVQVTRLKEEGLDVDPGHWQGVSTEGKPDLMTRELTNVAFTAPMIPVGATAGGWYTELDYWHDAVKPNLPWADDHFAERVSREPSNPGREYLNWPWWSPGKEKVTYAAERHIETPLNPNPFKFTHTYQERFWAKDAWLDAHVAEYPTLARDRYMGIRYDYGDLDDLINLLVREPHTRQAYLPIFFPEDTGAVHGGRIPCTLGYFFLLRGGKLHLWYTIRSCDVVRHYRDDIYLALRLGLWVLRELRFTETVQEDESAPYLWDKVTLGDFHFQAYSLHYHKGDEHHLSN